MSHGQTPEGGRDEAVPPRWVSCPSDRCSGSRTPPCSPGSSQTSALGPSRGAGAGILLQAWTSSRDTTRGLMAASADQQDRDLPSRQYHPPFFICRAWPASHSCHVWSSEHRVGLPAELLPDASAQLCICRRDPSFVHCHTFAPARPHDLGCHPSFLSYLLAPAYLFPWSCSLQPSCELLVVHQCPAQRPSHPRETFPDPTLPPN